MDIVVIVIGVLLVVGVLVLLATGESRQQARMRGGADDLRRADDGGDPPFVDYTSEMGP